MISKNSRIEYGPYTPDDAEAVTRVLADAFSHRDPPAMAVGSTAADFEEFLRQLCPRAPREGLTIVARVADTGEVVGAMLTEDCATPMPEGMDRLTPKFDPIIDILGQLTDEYWGDRKPRAGEAMHLFLLGVDQRVAGLGVAQRLVGDCLAHGAAKGYRLAVTEATNKTSQHIFRKQGFVERAHRSYASHLFRGRACFASIAEQGGPMLMDRSLGLK